MVSFYEELLGHALGLCGLGHFVGEGLLFLFDEGHGHWLAIDQLNVVAGFDLGGMEKLVTRALVGLEELGVGFPGVFGVSESVFMA